MYVVEVKAEQKIDLAGYVRESQVEAENYAKARHLDPADVYPVVVIKRRGVADPAQWYAVMTLGEYMR